MLNYAVSEGLLLPIFVLLQGLQLRRLLLHLRRKVLILEGSIEHLNFIFQHSLLVIVVLVVEVLARLLFLILFVYD